MALRDCKVRSAQATETTTLRLLIGRRHGGIFGYDDKSKVKITLAEVGWTVTFGATMACALLRRLRGWVTHWQAIGRVRKGWAQIPVL